MSKVFVLPLMAVGLTLAGAAGASASSRLDIESYGDRVSVHSGTYGSAPPARLVIDDDDVDIEVAAGPCANGAPRGAVLSSDRKRKVFVMPCN